MEEKGESKDTRGGKLTDGKMVHLFFLFLLFFFFFLERKTNFISQCNNNRDILGQKDTCV